MDSRAALLTGAIDGLAGALRRAGAPEPESARLLELASIATLLALALREELRAPGPARPSATGSRTPAALEAAA